MTDKDKQRWVDTNANPEDEANAALAPPSDLDLSRNNSASDLPGAAAVPNPADVLGNRFAAAKPGQRRGLQGRVDVFKNSQSMPALSAAAGGLMPPSMVMPLAPMAAPEAVEPMSHNTNHIHSGPVPMMPAANNVGHPYAPVDADNNQAGYDNNNYYNHYAYADQQQQQQQVHQEPAPAGGAPMFFNPAAFPAAASAAATKKRGMMYAS